MEKFFKNRKKLLIGLAYAQGAFCLIAGVCLALWPAARKTQLPEQPLNRFDRESADREIGSILN